MLPVAFAALVVVFAVVLWFQDRQNRRLHEMFEAHRLELLGRDDRALKERADLLQRIQAPEVAVAQHSVVQHQDTPPAVPVDDDMQYWESQSDVAEALERISLMEREGLA